MTARISGLKPLHGDQAVAVDPGIHAALSASAGTGKTQVLTARVLRLLLSGVAPESILCLTFTKAGAAEMANRIGARLAAWVRMPDPVLRKELYAIGEANHPERLQRARRLFAKVLDAPGGLRIQTIHSFAQTLLASFPAEAGITPGFQPIEGRAEQELARTTLANLLADAERSGDRQLMADVQCLSVRVGEKGATDYLMDCARVPDVMTALGLPEDIDMRLRRMMGLPEGDLETVLQSECSDDRFNCELLYRLLEANRQWETDSGRTICENIEEWLNATPKSRASGLSKLATKLVTKDFRAFKVSPKQIAVCGDYEELVEELATRLGQLASIEAATHLVRDMAAGLRSGQAFAQAYTHAKRAVGVADFNDLIAWTRRLLKTDGMGDWVRYKLDRRTDHILVDESQDTNRQQWEIIEALAAEYFSGAGASDQHRTIFMVGDFKQAIFGFQGTDPAEFQEARNWVRSHASALAEAARQADLPAWAALEFRDLSIDASFRSAPAVVESVDAVIREVGYREMGLPDPPNAHAAFFRDRSGTVELWPPFDPGDDEVDEGEEGWLDETERLYASRIAEQVRDWLAEAPVLESTKRPLSAGDILILVRSRGELASLIVARLFEEGVPVAGIDRLHLQKPLAVQDLIAAVAFAVQPLDDLALANLLVSPLIGWTQDQLRDLAFGRQGSLWAELRQADPASHVNEARNLLSQLLAAADYTTPHRFLETILSGPIGGRRKLYARLGMAARDPIEELLSSALEFEAGEIASLDRFLAWFSRGNVEVKRDPSAPANAVRVMTVHGSKGLEAPFVLIADASADPAKLGGVSRTIDLPVPGAGNAPLIRPRKAERIFPFAEIMQADEERDLQEHWRLLYVGLTRAVERLVVAGVKPGRALAENSWHVRVERALTSLGAEWQEDGRWSRRLVYRGDVPAKRVRERSAKTALPPLSIPNWTSRPAPEESRPPRPLAPSAMGQDREAAQPPSAAMRAAARRGTLIHQLFERLPEVEEAQRRQLALNWLNSHGGVTEAALAEEIAGQVCDVLGNPDFAALFGPGSLAEAPIAATLSDGRVLAGTVDRLLIEPARVSVVDYKTGRPPDSEADIPPPHRRQMEAYVEALRIIFPGREVRAALLYTAAPRLFELAA
ncbi:double-strand break repair helicase AddA [Sphingomonas piscis]|uniref:DNA 3'-5' helicase n=1 Tax=Sphingomonas piscis TaxID=2714943 RepID=A0A6G7YTQ8_9SPHN|nr:double-strand break repair helicase AddA [Sphingomonas piscis]